jgi:DNA polymerase-3 subunit beta
MLTVQQPALAKVLALVGRAATTRSTLPVLANFLLLSEGNILTIAATNLELAIVHRLLVAGQKDMSYTVSAKKLHDTIAALPAGDVTLAVEKNRLSVIGGPYSNRLSGIDADEFPALPAPDQTGRKFVVPVEWFLDSVRSVITTAATDEARPILTGLRLSFTPDGEQTVMEMQTADGFRLAVRAMTLSFKLAEAFSAVIPARSMGSLEQLAKALGATGDLTISFSASGSQAIFDFGSTTVSATLIEGAYPDLEAVIPKTSTTVVTLSRDSLARACRVADIIAADAGYTVRLTVTSEAKEMRLAALSAETGDNLSIIDLDAASGPDLTIAFNVKYIEDVLESTDCDQIQLSFNTAAQPGLFQPVVESRRWLYTLMPMAIANSIHNAK